MGAKGATWGLLFGGHKALMFQRVKSGSRHGLIFSDIIKLEDVFCPLLAALLAPANLPPLIECTKIPVPAAILPSNTILTQNNAHELIRSVTSKQVEMSTHSSLLVHSDV